MHRVPLLYRINRFPKSSRIIVRAVTMTVMILLFVSSCFAYYYMDGYTSVRITANFAINMGTLVFLFILYVFNYTTKYGDNMSARYFELLTLLMYLVTYLSSLTILYYGRAEMRNVISLLSTVAHGILGLFYMVFWGYHYSVNQPKRYGRALTMSYMSIALLYIIVSLTNPFTGLQYKITADGYTDYLYNDIVTCSMLTVMSILFTIYIVNLDCSVKKMISMLSYFFFPEILIIVNVIGYYVAPNVQLPSLTQFVCMASLYLVFLNVHVDQKNELIRRRAEYTEMKSALMLSQIQPHFIYNSLATISALCDFDPQLAKETTNKFSDYLRANIEAMSAKALIPFEKELKHVEAYTDLEKTRFGDKLTIEYNIKVKDFSVPSLALQPIVENAVKHGVCRKREGGKVRIATWETENSYFIAVEDTGVGFDSTKKNDNEEGKHIGIVNVKSRLRTLVNGTLTVESVRGKGTTAIIEIPKAGGKAES